MIESGSHVPGIDPAKFGLLPHEAMRWEQPHASLEGLIGDYFIFDSEGPESVGSVEWMLPNWPVIRFALAENPMTIEAPDWRWSPLLEAGFYGPTSRVLKHTSSSGVSMGVSLTPAGVACSTSMWLTIGTGWCRCNPCCRMGASNWLPNSGRRTRGQRSSSSSIVFSWRG